MNRETLKLEEIAILPTKNTKFGMFFQIKEPTKGQWSVAQWLA